ncbi:DNA primase [uncultured Sphingomonas sp.]|uniref:DNA primase n=1 Tax=uncultured Sphingomonas sp. TaxID=158754 RepID=UPI0025F7D065|nr:DNA primase [uncultured Sphingomonas sp.]
MSLSPAFLDELRHRTTLSGLIGKTTKLQKAGREFRACCPFHNEKSPSFYVNDDKGFYHCFGCGAHGDAIRWLTDNRGLPFIDAVKELAQAAGLDMPAMDRKAAEKAERAKGLTEAMADAAAWFTTQLQGIAGGEARTVLEKRGVKPDTAAAFGLGFAPDSRGKLKDALKEYGDPMLVEAGLLIAVDGKAPYDRFRGRLMIPIRDARSRVIAFGGRIIGEGEPKYLNSPETPLFDKGRTLYNIDRALPAARKSGRVIVVEGYMDVIALAQGGIDEVVAPLGTALTEHQLERLWQMADVPILCFDGDTAGQKAAIRAAQRALPLLKPGKSLAFATLPPGLDPDDVIGAGGRKAFEGILNRARSLDEFLWVSEFGTVSPMAGPDERGSLLHRLYQIADTIADPILKSQYRDTFRERFYGVFGSKAQRFSVVQAVSEPVQRPRKGLAYSVQRAVLLGLMRYPEVLKARIEDVVDLPLGSRALIELRDRLVELAYQWAAEDIGEITHEILSDTYGINVDPRLYTEDLAFTFYFSRDAFPEARADLERLIDLIIEEHLARRAVALGNTQVERDLSEQTYNEQQAARQLVDEARNKLAEWVDQFRTAA